MSLWNWLRKRPVAEPPHAVAKMIGAGLTEGKWLHSGAPCHASYPPTEEDLKRDAAHRAVNGKRFPLSRGMIIDGQATYPHTERGCKCVTNPMVPGFE